MIAQQKKSPKLKRDVQSVRLQTTRMYEAMPVCRLYGEFKCIKTNVQNCKAFTEEHEAALRYVAHARRDEIEEHKYQHRHIQSRVVAEPEGTLVENPLGRGACKKEVVYNPA
tara:strand:- start:647 stop:982 length:336 start_codon:yes stop_codon:yes gene_type:complete